MASSPITSWQIDGKTMETVTEFIFLAPKSLQMVAAAMKLEDACCLEGKLYKTNLDSRVITLQTKVLFLLAMVFLLVMY